VERGEHSPRHHPGHGSRTGRWKWIVTLHEIESDTGRTLRALESEHLRFATDDNILDLFPRST
jgi:hypothetical protein